MLAVLTAVAGLLTAWLHPKAPAYGASELGDGAITLPLVLTYPGDVVWVDARSRSYYDAGHIPGAIWLSEDDWETGLDAFFAADPFSGKLVVVYCDSAACHSSEAVVARLKAEFGEDAFDVRYLEGGWQAWEGREAIGEEEAPL